MGLSLTTLSPSSTTSMRKTPCADGCCGPIEISSRSLGTSPLPLLGRSSYVRGATAGAKLSMVSLMSLSLHLRDAALFAQALRREESVRIRNRPARHNLCASDSRQSLPTSKCAGGQDGRRTQFHKDRTPRVPEIPLRAKPASRTAGGFCRFDFRCANAGSPGHVSIPSNRDDARPPDSRVVFSRSFV